MRQTLAALTAMKIRFPGKTEEEAESVLDEVGAFFSVEFAFALPDTVVQCVLLWIRLIQIKRQKQYKCKKATKKL